MARITAKLIRSRMQMACALLILNALTILVGGVVVTGVNHGRRNKEASQ